MSIESKHVRFVNEEGNPLSLRPNEWVSQPQSKNHQGFSSWNNSVIGQADEPKRGPIEKYHESLDFSGIRDPKFREMGPRVLASRRAARTGATASLKGRPVPCSSLSENLHKVGFSTAALAVIMFKARGECKSKTGRFGWGVLIIITSPFLGLFFILESIFRGLGALGCLMICQKEWAKKCVPDLKWFAIGFIFSPFAPLILPIAAVTLVYMQSKST